MFDIEKEEMQEAAPAYEGADWERITATHAQQEHDATHDAAMKNQGKREAFQDFYHKRRIHRKDRVAVESVRYGLLAVGLATVGYIVRSLPWLAIGLGIIALVLALIAAYGAGKYREM
jgi:hypothetical protein